MEFKELNLSFKSNEHEITIGDKKIKVKNRISSKDIEDLISITIQDSIEPTGIINLIKTEINFSINLLLMYTDLEFTGGELEDVNSLYDILDSNDILNQVIMNIDEIEYKFITDMLNDTIAVKQQYELSLRGSVMGALVAQEEAINNLDSTIENIDIAKVEQVVDVFKRVK